MKQIFRTLMHFLLLMTIVVPAGAQESRTQPLLGIFFSGKRHAQLETCGCTETSQGGLFNEPALYERLGGVIPTLRVDVGLWQDMQAAHLPIKAAQSQYLLRAFELLQYDAINVAMVDSQLSPAWFERLEQNHPV